MANQFASTSLTATVGLLKNWYAGSVVTQFNDELPLYRDMEKGKEKFQGLQVVRALKVRRNPGIGATSDGGLLPTIGTQTTINPTIAAKFLYLRFGLTGPMLKSAQGDKGAFANIMSYEMEQGMIDLKNDVNRQMFWDGSADLGLVAANVVASNVVTANGRVTNEPGNKYLDVGMVIDIVNAAGTAILASGLTINAMSGTTTVTMTLSAPVTCSANDVIVRSGSFNNEVQGLLTSLDGGTSTIYSVDRSAYQVYQGNAISGSGGQLTLNLMQQAMNEARRRGDGKISTVITDFDSERFYNKLLVADRRYVSSTATGDGSFIQKGKSYLEFGGCPVVPDKDCPNAYMFFLDPTTWKKYVLSELEWADESGSQMIAQVSSDSWEVRLRLFFNIFPEKPSANAVLNSYISP